MLLQPQLGKYGLFTLLNVAKVLGQGLRGALACNILRNIQWHWRNVTLFYQAELYMKYNLFCDVAQVRQNVHISVCALSAPAEVSGGAYVERFVILR